MKISNTLNITWRPDQFSIEGRSGYVINHKQVEYFKSIVQALVSMYSDISNAINAMSYISNGAADVASGTTTIVVSHGLSNTPGLNDIAVTPTNDLGNAAKFWISTPTASSFTINVDSDPGAGGASFAWEVNIIG
jgi:hypothetical protein